MPKVYPRWESSGDFEPVCRWCCEPACLLGSCAFELAGMQHKKFGVLRRNGGLTCVMQISSWLQECSLFSNNVACATMSLSRIGSSRLCTEDLNATVNNNQSEGGNPCQESSGGRWYLGAVVIATSLSLLHVCNAPAPQVLVRT